MGIDLNDVKILINAGFQYLIKTCVQWAKDHPLVSGVLLFFYLLYLFVPYLFNILFYTFPLIICIAILLGGKHISKRHNLEQTNNNNNKKYDILRTMSIDPRRRPRMSSHMRSKTTLGNTETFFDNFPTSTNSTQIEVSRKNVCDNSTSSSCIPSEKTSPTQTSRHTSAGISSHSDTDEEENDEDLARESRKRVVEWTEDDQRNLMDLGSSEIERNKRLESLIAKRRARKQFSMQPRRTHYPYENLMDQVGSIMVSRCIDHDAEHQPGSAPCVLRQRRNPFDLPYDPHEEKPILTGGSFDDEFFSNEQKEFILGECLNKNEGFVGEFMEDPVVKSLPSFFFSKPKVVEKPVGFTRFRRESEENMKEMLDELSSEDARKDQAANKKDSSKKVQLSSGLTRPNDEHNELVNPFAKDFDNSKPELPSSSKNINEDEQITKDDKAENTSHVDSGDNVTQLDDPDNASMNKDRDEDDNDGDSTSTSSSADTTINAIKNEAFRNSVKKVLNCLVIQRNRANLININTHDSNIATTSNGLLYDSIPSNSSQTKMEERSFYTNRPHHTKTFSIASDMQVEVSDPGSPPLATLEPSSPTDQESLVYDGDVDKDANSGDEDLWGASPHPMKLGEFANKLPDITEEGNDVKGQMGEIVSLSQGEEVGQDQRSIDAEIVGSRSSVSSSSDDLMSHMQAKSEHLAEYLANLPPAESGSNVLGEPEPSHVRESSMEEHTMFELDEAKDESIESEDLRESHQGSSEQSNNTCVVRATKGTNSISSECTEGELDNQAMKAHDEPALAENDAMETGSYFSEPIGHEKEAISDSFSTTCQEDILEQSRLEEDRNVKLEDDIKIPVDGDVRDNSVNDHPVTHDKSKLLEKAVGDQANHAIFEEKKFETDKPIVETDKVEEAEDAPQPATIEEDNMEALNSTEAVSSRPSEDLNDDYNQPSSEEPTVRRLDESREKLKESEDMGEPRQGSSEKTTILNETRAITETNATASVEGGFDNQPSKTEDEPSLVEKDAKELESLKEPTGHEMEANTDSFSTTCQEEILEQSGIEGYSEKSEEVIKPPSDGEVGGNSADENIVTHSADGEKAAADRAKHASFDENEPSVESGVKLREAEDATQSETVEEDNMGASNSTEAVSSRSIEDFNDKTNPSSSNEHPIFKLDEPKDESRESEVMGKSRQASNDQSTIPDEARATKETNSILSEGTQGVLEKQARTIEDEPSLVEKDENKLELEPSFSKPIGHEKEAIPDSYSTTLVEKVANDQVNQAILEEKKSELDKPIIESESKLQEAGDASQPATVVEDNTVPSNSTDVVSSTPINDLGNKTNHPIISDILEDKNSKLDKPIIESELKLQEAGDVSQPATVAEDNTVPSNSTEVLSSTPINDLGSKTNHPIISDVLEDKNSKLDKPIIESDVKLREAGDISQPATVEVDTMEPSKSIEAVSSTPIDHPIISVDEANHDDFEEKKSELDKPIKESEAKLGGAKDGPQPGTTKEANMDPSRPTRDIDDNDTNHPIIVDEQS